MGRDTYTYGTSGNGIPFVRWGSGKKKCIIFQGGPGNTIPHGMGLRAMISGFDPLTRDFTLYLVTRKLCMPRGYTTSDMARDYADMITADLDGYVDLAVGTSFGGMIAQHFGADYPDCYGKLVIALAAHKMSEQGKRIDTEYAELVSRGKMRKAVMIITDALTRNPVKSALLKSVGWLMGGTFMKATHDCYKKDVLIEAAAEVNHDAEVKLPGIVKPVLIICGGDDVYFPRKYALETGKLIPGSAIRIYEGKGHMSTMTDKRFGLDIMDFVNT
ncbi:MAG: alpha/beta fold hydrolase [Spirochaetia bacterium]